MGRERFIFDFFGKYTQINPYINIFAIKVKINNNKKETVLLLSNVVSVSVVFVQ